jgi:alpha-glucosidase (family GH31 glycosyl hydrolase)
MFRKLNKWNLIVFILVFFVFERFSLKATSVGNVSNFVQTGTTLTFACGTPKARVIFYTHDIFRIWLAPDGNFTAPAEIVVSNNFPVITIAVTDLSTYYKVETNTCVLRIYKTPLRFALYNKDNSTMVFEESSPLDYGTSTHQRLIRGENEYFYGCGMQNGYFSHRGQSLKIGKSDSIYDDFEPGGHPNPAPFYMSTNGYGAFRNTWQKGYYNFYSPLDLYHDENRFDCYYFYGPGLKKILDGYTQITGRPFLPPIWGLEFGDADCYKPTSNIITMANAYRTNDMPGGWFLPNDGYGCGYTDLPTIVSQLHDRGFYTGIWTDSGINPPEQVGTSGTRGYKLDMGWIGSGGVFCFNGCKKSYEGIETNSTGRGFVWTTMGWAGTQRYAVMWTGDQSGSWDWIKWHIPTIIGSGLSAQNCATSDIDGIFGGSGPIYVRDMQWKCFLPAMMVISGWANTDKQPFAYGEPYTSYNRKSLKLKMRLTPYIYSYCHQAYKTGVPVGRGMILEFPQDSKTWDTTTQYQFMSGEWFLVAPVYASTTSRSNIYFPAGKWFDYWDGTEYTGPYTLNNYPAPLDKLPLFVKAGAIIPMYPEMLYNNQQPKNPLTLDIYPQGSTSFTLYEDDGLTREHRSGAYAETVITADKNNDAVSITVSAANGNFTGKLSMRSYLLEIHSNTHPNTVAQNTTLLTEYSSQTELDAALDGWFYNAVDRKGVIHVKTKSLSTAAAFSIHINAAVTVADFSYQINKKTVNFSDQSSSSNANIISWNWNFGDNTASTIKNPSHSYAQAGSYTVTLTVMNDQTPAESATVSKTVMIDDMEIVFQDDFESAKGWVSNANNTDTATLGLWERAVPEATNYEGAMQLSQTVSGTYDLVTGPLAGASARAYDVDGGLTSIRSPQIVLPNSSKIMLYFNYYLAHYSNATAEDYLKVSITGSSTTQVLLVPASAAVVTAAWKLGSQDITQFAGQTVTILIEAADNGTGSLLEAAVDDVIIKATPGGNCPYDHLVGSFPGIGMWLRDSQTAIWTQLSKQQADIIRVGDINGNGKDDIAAYFKATGKLWYRYDNGVWEDILASAATLTAYDLADMNHDGREDLVGSWSDKGLWWRNNVSAVWTKLSAMIPTFVAAADFNGDSKADVVGLFPSLNSIWIYYSNNTWKQISKQINLKDLRAGNMDSDGEAELIGSWDIGVWMFDPITNLWIKHHANQAKQICVGDINAQCLQDIVGYWDVATPLYVKYMENNTWNKLSNYSPDTLDAGKIK